MQLMKRQKILIAFVVVALILSLILAVTYGNLSHRQSTATLEMPIPLPFQVQVISPLDNYTYGSYNGPLKLHQTKQHIKLHTV
jgi:hypothetical protein